MFVVFKNKLDKYDNLYTYSLSNKTFKNYCLKFGEKHQYKMYMTVHLAYFLFTGSLSILQFYSQLLNTLVLGLCLLSSVWNGANFYMEWFAKKYEKHLVMLKDP